MSSKFVRVTAKHIVRDGSEPMAKIQFDLKIDAETKAVLGKWNIFCVWGSYKEDGQDVHPLVLLEDGRIDYGTEWEEHRFGQMNIREKPIEVGTYFEVTDSDEETYTYAVMTVAVLGEGLVS